MTHFQGSFPGASLGPPNACPPCAFLEFCGDGMGEGDMQTYTVRFASHTESDLELTLVPTELVSRLVDEVRED